MQRLHTCHKPSLQFCLPCRLKLASKFVKYGEPLFSCSPAELLKLIRKQFLLFGQSVSQLTWKAFRAGHAIHLAIKGASISRIMEAGEWRSKTFLHYVDEDSVPEGDAGRFQQRR